MNKTAYIAGRITGLPKEDVKTKFDYITDQLSNKGYKVELPIGVNNEAGSWNEAIRTDIKKMLDCDEVHLLPDWQESKGAKLERDIAIRLGMQVIYH